MAKVALKKASARDAEEVRSYARKIWLAGLGAYAKVGKEGIGYFKALIKAGEGVQKQGKKLIDREVAAANTELDEATTELSLVKSKVGAQFEKIESAFDARVASGLNRMGIPSRHDVETLSAKLDNLTALLDRAARKN